MKCNIDQFKLVSQKTTFESASQNLSTEKAISFNGWMDDYIIIIYFNYSN